MVKDLKWQDLAAIAKKELKRPKKKKPIRKVGKSKPK
jgi:hypothetical protein